LSYIAPRLEAYALALADHGCTLVRATVLRDGYDHIKSKLFYGQRTRHDNISASEAKLHVERMIETWQFPRDSQLKYILYNHCAMCPQFYEKNPRAKVVSEQEDAELASAKDMIRRFEIIGFTDELASFTARLTEVCGLRLAPLKSVNKNPMNSAIDLSASHRNRLAKASARDTLLFTEAHSWPSAVTEVHAAGVHR
jgi:hypothetical protein